LAGTKPILNNIMNILFGQTFLHNVNREEVRQHWFNHLLHLKKSITRCVEGVINRSSVYDEIKNISIPTLVLVGDEDVATVPEKARRIHKQINGSVFEIIKGAGHSSSIEQPELVNHAIAAFIKAPITK
jgi:pimeloyl-ACP methyl ester carboxylesterase